MKQWLLRHLPEPICWHVLYKRFGWEIIATAEEEAKALEAVRRIPKEDEPR